MKIVAGTYEGFCYGWESSVEPSKSTRSTTPNTSTNASGNDSQQMPSEATTDVEELSLTFGYNVHVGCLKSVAMATSGNRAGRLLVTGGADERVRIYDMKDRTELGELQQHNGEKCGVAFSDGI